MIDPCIGCKRIECTSGSRKVDCLTQYPRLRLISNSRAGFGGISHPGADWSEHELRFYNSQVRARYPDWLPDIL